jgi:hypothetical protein
LSGSSSATTIAASTARVMGMGLVGGTMRISSILDGEIRTNSRIQTFKSKNQKAQ